MSAASARRGRPPLVRPPHRQPVVRARGRRCSALVTAVSIVLGVVAIVDRSDERALVRRPATARPCSRRCSLRTRSSTRRPACAATRSAGEPSSSRPTGPAASTSARALAELRDQFDDRRRSTACRDDLDAVVRARASAWQRRYARADDRARPRASGPARSASARTERGQRAVRRACATRSRARTTELAAVRAAGREQLQRRGDVPDRRVRRDRRADRGRRSSARS